MNRLLMDCQELIEKVVMPVAYVKSAFISLLTRLHPRPSLQLMPTQLLADIFLPLRVAVLRLITEC